MQKITQRFVDSLRPPSNDTFYRDTVLIGFGLKVTPLARVSFLAEARVRGGRTRRITLGQHPAITVAEARTRAAIVLSQMQNGIDPVAARRRKEAKEAALSKSFGEVFRSYISTKTLKPSTIKDYSGTFRLVYSDWVDRPIRKITRSDVEQRFIATRENRGLATAGKAARISSAIFNFAMADEVDGERLLLENPTHVLKQKRIKMIPRKREGYLDERQIGKLISFYYDEKDWPETTKHGVTNQGINYVMLLLTTGLRRSEGLSLTWDNVNWDTGRLIIKDTKNGFNHYIPMSKLTQSILKRQNQASNQSPWVFPARYGSEPMSEPKSQLNRIRKATGLKFTLHDLRRTFATHAMANGAEYEMIRRALNHRSGSVTSQYIIGQIEMLRPVFEAVASGFHNYYDPGWQGDSIEETNSDLGDVQNI